MLRSLISWEAIALYALTGIGIVGWFVPFLRMKMIYAGLTILVILGIYEKGKRDARIAAAKRTQEAIERGREARRRAESDVNERGVRDPRDRDI